MNAASRRTLAEPSLSRALARPARLGIPSVFRAATLAAMVSDVGAPSAFAQSVPPAVPSAAASASGAPRAAIVPSGISLAASSALATAASLDGPSSGPADPVAAALAPRASGVTLAALTKAAVKHRPSLRAKQAELRAASARVDQALVNFAPRLTVSFTYTRLSEVLNGLGGGLGGGALLGAATPGPVQTGPCLTSPATNCVVDSAGLPVQAVDLSSAFTFPVLTDSYSFNAQLAVPISDYVLRLSQGYAAATHAASAKRLEVKAEALQAAADAKVVYFNWARTKGAVSVASEAAKLAKLHLADARKVEAAGLLFRQDILRIEAQVAGAEQFEVEARAYEALAAQQVLLALGLPTGSPLELGTDVYNEPAVPPKDTLASLQDEALASRLEVRALDETVYSLKQVERITFAGYFPRLDGFANLTTANPNPRVFPQANKFDTTWEIGLRLSFTVNDIALTATQVSEARARTQTVEEQKGALRDGLRLEVAAAFVEATKAAAARDAAERGLAAALEGSRVQAELFRAGKGKTLDLLDADAEVVRARLRVLDAHLNLAVARVRLEHASGRDVDQADGLLAP